MLSSLGISIDILGFSSSFLLFIHLDRLFLIQMLCCFHQEPFPSIDFDMHKTSTFHFARPAWFVIHLLFSLRPGGLLCELLLDPRCIRPGLWWSRLSRLQWYVVAKHRTRVAELCFLVGRCVDLFSSRDSFRRAIQRLVTLLNGSVGYFDLKSA